MKRYLLTAPCFVGGTLHQKGAVISFGGKPSKAMLEVDSNNRPVLAMAQKPKSAEDKQPKAVPENGK